MNIKEERNYMINLVNSIMKDLGLPESGGKRENEKFICGYLLVNHFEDYEKITSLSLGWKSFFEIYRYKTTKKQKSENRVVV